MSNPSTRHFFTPVSNEVFLNRHLTRRARQILLILEVRAGVSRVARLTQQQIAQSSGYALRTVKYSVRSLRDSNWISQTGDGEIRLSHPIPGKNYVQVYGGVVHHPYWDDWQKHLLLFVMSQFRTSDGEFGVPLCTLNLRGRSGRSVEKYCRVPGSVKERRQKIRQFVKQLEVEGILRIVDPATSNRPAICVISKEALEKMEPVGYRTSEAISDDVARLRFAPPDSERQCKPSPSNGANRNLRRKNRRVRTLQESS